MRRFLCATLLLLLVITTCLSFFTIKKQKDSGVSAVSGYVDGDVRRHVLTEYGDATSVEDVLWQMTVFACNNFRYNNRQADIQRLQWFDYMDFVDGETIYGGGPYSGICYDFAAYVSTVVRIVSEYKGWENVWVDTACIKSITKGSRHACNFIYVGDAVYYLDLTWDSVEYQKGRMEYVYGPVLLENQTPEQYCQTFGYIYVRTV